MFKEEKKIQPKNNGSSFFITTTKKVDIKQKNKIYSAPK